MMKRLLIDAFLIVITGVSVTAYQIHAAPSAQLDLSQPFIISCDQGTIRHANIVTMDNGQTGIQWTSAGDLDGRLTAHCVLAPIE